MKTCREDGLLLKPHKPATPIDKTFLQFGEDQPQIMHVWDTYSQHLVQNNVSFSVRHCHYKFITASSQRIKRILVLDNEIQVVLVGVPLEKLLLTLFNRMQGKIINLERRLSNDGFAVLTCSKKPSHQCICRVNL